MHNILDDLIIFVLQISKAAICNISYSMYEQIHEALQDYYNVLRIVIMLRRKNIKTKQCVLCVHFDQCI